MTDMAIRQEVTDRSKIMKCPNCGKEINGNQKFCTSCGAKIEHLDVKLKRMDECNTLELKVLLKCGIIVIIIAIMFFFMNKL